MHSPALSKSSRAQAIVEFALVLPFLVLMLAGIVDLGNGYQTYIALSNGAREGAAYGAYPIDGATDGTIIYNNVCARAKAALPANLQAGAVCPAAPANLYPGVSGDNNCPAGARNVRCPIRMTLSYSVNTLVGGVLGFNSFSVIPAVDMMVLQ